MKKGFCGVLLTLLLCIALVTPVFAEPGLPRLIDEAELLSAGEEAALLSQLDEVSERQEVDIVVVTANSLSGASAREYADDFYDDNGYGFGEDRDGILFLISMKEREWYISTRGYGITAVTDAGLEYMSEQFLGDLSEGSYASAFTTFVRLCDDFITQARTDMPYQTASSEGAVRSVWQPCNCIGGRFCDCIGCDRADENAAEDSAQAVDGRKLYRSRQHALNKGERSVPV